MSLFSTVFDFVDDTIQTVSGIFDGDSIFGDLAKAGLETLTNRKKSGATIMSPPSRGLFGVGSEVGIGGINNPGEGTGVRSVDIQGVYDEWKARLRILSGEYNDGLGE